MSYRVLIVDDHNLFRQGIRSMVMGLAGYEVIGDACDGKEAVQKAVSLRPDLILMELCMPGLNGIEAALQIKRRMPNIRILALTMQKTEDYVRAALSAGVDGYAVKDITYEEFLSAIHTVAKGKKFICSEVSMHLVDIYLHPASNASTTTVWDKLTSRERSILKLVAEGHTNRMSGEILNISSKTVEKHRANLMRKLDLHNATELIRLALDMGLIKNRSKPQQKIGVESSLNQY
jgi:DNA-binding NarL/FixJ family response regulator